MRKPTRPLFHLILILGLTSCANYQLNYSPEAVSWATETPLPDQPLMHTVFLVGDAGKGSNPALDLLERRVQHAGKESTVLFLGDNIYPNGMAPISGADRAQDEERLKAQLNTVLDYEGNVFFIAGNHDWDKYGIDGLKRQKKFIEKYLDREDVFFPDPGCGDPEEIEINDKLVIVLIDSEWYLSDWDKDYQVNAGCEVKSRAVFAEFMVEAIKGNRNKDVLIAMHHPPYSTGPHGGQFTFKQHLFPLTEFVEPLYLPLPVVGSIFQFLRGTVGHRQDLIHPKYQELSDIVVGAARRNGSFVIASGHEHSLQYIEQDEQSFIVSGAGSKTTATNARNGGQFAYGHLGFAQLDYYEDGSAWVKYWVPDENEPQGKLVFQKQVQPPLPKIAEDPPESFEPLQDSITIKVSENDFERGRLWNFFWGKHYRSTYNATVKLPVLDLTTYKGGVRPVKRGGGYQTNSLRLEGADGRQYALRSIDKDASRTLGYPFNESFVTAVLEDNFSSAHPFASIATADLAKAAGIYYTQPKMFYLPRQPALGIYNEDYAGALYTVEERPDDEVWNDYEQFGAPKRIRSTLDTRERIQEDHDEQIDYPFVVRNRLFDVLIGDWDRHDDQWRWSEIDSGEVDYYRPIPRDRDQAFSNYDGLILELAKGTTPDIKKLKAYRGDENRLEWLVYNGRHFDRTFLSGADWSVWEAEARHLQEQLTDEVIEQAFKNNWPGPVYQLNAPDIIQKLKTRRDNFMDIARKYYELMAKEVDIVGTFKRDLFVIERMEDGRTRIRAYDTNSKSEKELKFYDRTFLPEETREIAVYGLTDQDVFRVKGTCRNNCIKVRMIGGVGQDILEDESNGKGLIYYDAKNEGNLLQTGSKAKVKRRFDPAFNIYDRESNDYNFNYTSLLPAAGFNPDDGILLGLSAAYTTYGFKKDPYASQHKIDMKFATGTNGFTLDYQGEFIDLFGPFELGLDAEYQTPLYSRNFYGLGNESINIENLLDDEALNYNRIKQRVIRVMPSFMRRLNAQSRVLVGPTFESIEVERTEGRYIDEIGNRFQDELFDGLEFAGLRFLLDYKTRDNNAIPTRGLGFFLEGGWKQQLEEGRKNFAYLNTSFSAYQRIDRRGKLVFATRLEFQHRFSEDYEFYQGATLGGPGEGANFRGFRRDRFIGSTAFVHNTDLRWKTITSENPTLPFSLGLMAGFDHGRVWLRGEDSEVWHYSYGGGIWLSPFDLFVVSGGVYRGDNKDNRVVVTGGFFF